ncbi:MAG: hypothetical protein IT342_23145 [Candidatus Melainabacteria bacterium]|nr:hypothetical protein [Candidatus Melainabacteria bacterium]
MNKNQQLIILIGLLVTLAMGIYPPWVHVDEDKVTHAMGYAPIWKPPTIRKRDSAEILGFKLELDVRSQTANTLDIARLLTQFVVLSVIVGGALVLTKKA